MTLSKVQRPKDSSTFQALDILYYSSSSQDIGQGDEVTKQLSIRDPGTVCFVREICRHREQGKGHVGSDYDDGPQSSKNSSMKSPSATTSSLREAEGPQLELVGISMHDVQGLVGVPGVMVHAADRKRHRDGTSSNPRRHCAAQMPFW